MGERLAVRASKRRVLAIFLAVAGASVLPVPATPIAEAAPSSPARAAAAAPATDDGAAELAEAERTGSPVVVDGWTSETTEISALPSGEFRAAISAAPVRKEHNGSWIDLDSTLERRANGTVGPKSAIGDVELSGGGAADSILAKISADGATTTIRTPFALPAPTLHEDTAVYADVIPDVDLVTTASNTGFTFNWVVKSRAAADDSRVRKLSLPVETSGLTATADRGGFMFRDSKGLGKFWTPTPTMWDSSGAPSADPVTGESAETTLDAVDDGPDMKDRVSPVTAAIGGGRMTLTPDLSLLDAADVVFPVVIDPAMTYAKTRNGWTAVWNNFPNKSFWQTEHSLGAGYEGYEQFKVVRSYFRFDTSGIRGKEILGAELNVRQIHAASCQARPTDAYRTGSIGTGTTWNNQPTRYTLQDSNSSTTGCGTGTGMVGWDVTQGATVLADTNAATGTFMVRARDEGDKIAWKQFDDAGAELAVTYVSKPTRPTAVTITTPNGTIPCGTSTAVAMVGSTSVTLGVKVTSADGASASLKGVFRRHNNSTGADYPDIAGTTVASGGTSTLPWTTVENGHSYRFVAKNRVSWTYNGSPGYLDSAFNENWCYFRVDTSRPEAPTIDSTDFGECASAEAPDDCSALGEVGVAGDVLLDTASSDAVSYRWSLNGGPVTTTATTAGAARTISVTPNALMNTLSVYTVDGAGNQSLTATHIFKVAPRAVDVQWSFNDPAAIGADTGRDQDAPLALGGTWSDGVGRVEEALSTAGGAPATSPITASAGVSATSNFSIGAWVRLDAPAQGTTTTLLSATFSQGNVFEFGYEPASNKWTAGRRSGTSVSLASSTTAALHVWTHLAATYDTATKNLKFYVNGRLAGTVTYPSAAWVSSNWRLGCGNLAGVASSCMTGLLDEVNLYQAILAPDEIRDLADPTSPSDNLPLAAPAASWAMDEPDDAAVAADACHGSDLALANVPSPRFQPALLDPVHRTLYLTGTSTQQVRRSHPVVDSTGSFTIAANVRPNDPTKSMVIAQQRGAAGDSWTLAYEAEPSGDPSDPSVGRWVFQRATTDSATATVVEVRSPLTIDVDDQSTVLVATYDRKRDTIALYVNGDPIETGPDPEVEARFDASFTTAWAARGELNVGNGTLNGAAAPFGGEIERLDAFAGAMRPSQVSSYEESVWQ